MWRKGRAQLRTYIEKLNPLRTVSVKGLIEEVACPSHPSLHKMVFREWSEAKSVSSLPGPSRFQLIRAFLPRGYLRGKFLIDIFRELQKEYGDIFMLPGTFGKNNIVVSFNPKDYQKVFLTEGQYPKRRGFDIIHYYRKVYRKEIYKYSSGLVVEQGESWGKLRSIVNPVIMNPKNTLTYIPKLNIMADRFIARIRSIRDVDSKEVPTNFIKDINNWVMDSVGLIALDAELGLLNNDAKCSKGRVVIDGMSEFFDLLYQLDLQPSLWKYVATPQFKKAIRTLEEVSDLAIFYVDEAIRRLEEQKSKGLGTKADESKSILEQLLKYDRNMAAVMAMDLLLAGVETTSTAITSSLLSLAKNPEKQDRLRKELREILPTTDCAITSGKMRSLPYLRACIKEAYRVFPVSTTNLRTTGQDVVLSGYRVPKDTDIAMPWHILTEEAKYFSRPTEYIPERWLRKDEQSSTGRCPLNSNEPFIFLPFGYGPRNCAGKRISDLELEVILARLVRNFEIHFDYSTENLFRMNVIKIPAKPLQFRFIDVNN